MVVFWYIIIFFLYLISILSLLYVFLIAISFFREAPFVPLDKKLIEESFKLLEIHKGDRVLDIGSGDGRVVRYFANQSKGIVKYTGIEIDRLLSIFSNILNVFSIYRERTTFLTTDALSFDLKPYNKIFMYLTSELSTKILSERIRELNKGSIIVCAVFKPKIDSKIEKIEISNGKKIYKLYVVRT